MSREISMSEKVLVPDTIIPAFPYEGALYWLFSERGTPEYKGGHSYYLSLYGPEHDRVVPRATALAALFDRLILAPADARLPDYRAYSHGDTYEHPDLRITMNWEPHKEWDDENRAIAKILIKSDVIGALLASVPLFASDNLIREHFLCRSLLQIRLSQIYSGVLIGNSFFNRIYDAIIREVGEAVFSIPIDGQQMVWTLEERTLNIVGLDFPADSIDSFSAIRQSREISEYATEFRAAISSAMTTGDATNSLLQLMKKAMDQDEIRAKAAGGFQALGSAANVGGLVPVLGTFASGIGIGADVASRKLGRASLKKQWYLLGPKMKEVALKSMLSKLPNK
jgi:hypothetical protein